MDTVKDCCQPKTSAKALTLNVSIIFCISYVGLRGSKDRTIQSGTEGLTLSEPKYSVSVAFPDDNGGKEPVNGSPGLLQR